MSFLFQSLKKLRLGYISINASIEEIQKAYRLKIKDFHPDRNVNVTPAVKTMLEEQAQLLNAARDILIANR